jgi:hypothetical protein
LLAASKLAEVVAIGPENWMELNGDFGEDYPDYTWQVESTQSDVEGLTQVAVSVHHEVGGEISTVKIEEFLFVQ